MRILLVGEYSNLHNSLKAGLEFLGHEVVLLSTGDGFKKLPSDIDVRGKYFQDQKILNLVRKLVFRISGEDLSLTETALRTLKYLKNCGSFDVVQLINEYPLKTPYYFELKILKKLRAITPKLIVLASGDDRIYMENLHKLHHHPIRHHKGKISFRYSEKYLTAAHKSFHKKVFKMKDLVISSDMDYHTVYKNSTDYYGLIPNPVNLDLIKTTTFPALDKIVIFHGINRINYYKKGNDLFEKALELIQSRYADLILIETAESLPYSGYIQRYDRAHILLDQTYALDQGYNALEAMAKGKVVFTGASEEFCAHYGVEPNSVAIHTMPDAEKIAADLEHLILNPDRIKQISKNAVDFIRTYHDHRQIAARYLSAWKS